MLAQGGLSPLSPAFTSVPQQAGRSPSARRASVRTAAPRPALRRLAGLLLVAALGAGLAACRAPSAALAPDADLAAARVRFGTGAISVTLPPGHGLTAVRLLDASGALVGAAAVSPRAPVTLDFPAAWPPGGAWLLQGAGEHGRPAVRTLTLPRRRPPPVEVRLQLPTGLDVHVDGERQGAAIQGSGPHDVPLHDVPLSGGEPIGSGPHDDALPDGAPHDDGLHGSSLNGSGLPGGAPLALPEGGEGALTLSVRNASPGPLLLRVTLRLPAALRPDGAPAESHATFRLDLPGATAELTRPLRIHRSVPSGSPPAIVWEIAGAPEPLTGSLRVVTLDRTAWAAGLRIVASRYPADGLGRVATHLPAERIVLEPPFAGRWRGVFGASAAADPYRPRGHVRLEVANDLPGAAVVVVRSWVQHAPQPDELEGGRPDSGRLGPDRPALGGASDDALPAFGPPLLSAVSAVVSLARIGPGARAVLVQPFYADPARLAAGPYERCTRLEPWGLAAAGVPTCVPFRIEASPLGRWLALWLATGAALALLVALVLRARSWLPAFPLRDRVLIALTITLALLLVSLPALPLAAVSAVLLGPFGFLAEGLLFKLGLFVLLGALVAWIPRPGTYALFYLLWMAGQALLSGHYGPLVVLFAGIPILLLESAWWACGLTRQRAPGRAAVPVAVAALSAGIAEALIVFWDLHLLQALYRQYLAEGFIVFQAASAGVYAACGFAVGLPLGRRLRAVRRPALPEEPIAASGIPGKPARAAWDAAGSVPLLRVEHLTYAYSDTEWPALDGVSLEVSAGEIVLLAGATGCGKTTLLRAIQGLLSVDARRIRLRGVARSACTQVEWAHRCALLFQEPALQVLRLTPGGEVTLALELGGAAANAEPPGGRSAGQLSSGALARGTVSRGTMSRGAPASTDPIVPRDSVSPRDAVALGNSDSPRDAAALRNTGARRDAALTRFDLLALAERPVRLLSGGEVQRTALAALLAGGPNLLLLDEPLAHLDRVQRGRLCDVLRELAAGGAGVLMAEHRADLVLPIATRALWMEEGRIAWQGAPAAFPYLRRGAGVLARPGPMPVAGAAATDPAGPALLELDGLTWRHAGQDAPLFSGVHARLAAGGALALAGPNGAGKSTLLQLIAGLRRPTGGSVRVSGENPAAWPWSERSRRVGWLPQQVELILSAESVAEELALPLRARGLKPDAIAAAVERWLERLGLAQARGRFPHLLSRGERQRLALGTLLIAGPDLLLLDEPFAGQDARQAAALGELCRAHLAAAPQRAALIATHDVEQVRPWVDGLWRLEAGRLTVAHPPGQAPLPAPAQTARAALAGGGA